MPSARAAPGVRSMPARLVVRPRPTPGLPIGIVGIPRSDIHDVANDGFVRVQDPDLWPRAGETSRKRDAEFFIVDQVAIIGARIRVGGAPEHGRRDATEELDSRSQRYRLHVGVGGRWPTNGETLALGIARYLDLMALIATAAYVGVALRPLEKRHVMIAAPEVEDQHVAGLRGAPRRSELL